MAFHFKIVFDQDGEVLGVEPPQGTILTCNGIDMVNDSDRVNEAEELIKPLEKQNIDIKIDIYKKSGDPCVKVGNKLWCW